MELADLIEGFEKLPAISQRLERIEEKLDRLLEATPVRRFVDISWICAELGCSRDWLRSRLWILPAFGVPDVSGTPKRWKLETWRSWSNDLAAREQVWRALSDDRRREILKEGAA